MAFLDLTGGRREAKAPPTQQYIDRRRQLADALMANVTRPQMSYSPLQTIATVLQGGLSGYVGSRADSAEEERAKMLREILMGGTPSAAAQTGTGGAAAPQSGDRVERGAPVSGYTVDALAPPDGAKARPLNPAILEALQARGVDTGPAQGFAQEDTRPGMAENLSPNVTPIVPQPSQGGGGVMGNLNEQQRALIGYLLDSGNEQAAVGLVGEMLFSQPESNATSAMREYELAKTQGFEGSFLDYQTALKQAGRTSITNAPSFSSGGGIQVGTIPQGYQLEYDEQGRPARMSPVTGSPAELERTKAEDAARNRAEMAATAAQGVLGHISTARNLAKNQAWYSPTTGLGGAAMRGVPGTDARDLSALVTTIKANIGFDRLQQMREASPTGGALGQVAIQELDALQNSIANLDQAQSREQFLAALDEVEQRYTSIVRKFAAYPNAAEFGFGGGGSSDKPSERELQFMTPEERALFQ